jgi:hypothetical protein
MGVGTVGHSDYLLHLVDLAPGDRAMSRQKLFSATFGAMRTLID